MGLFGNLQDLGESPVSEEGFCLWKQTEEKPGSSSTGMDFIQIFKSV